MPENLKTYLQKINFGYVKTFSGLRGDKFAKLEAETKTKIKALEQDLTTARYMQKARIQAEIKRLTNLICPENNLLIDTQGVLHPSATEILHVKYSDHIVKRIFEILAMDYEDQGLFLCIPVYRDAVVFYSSDDQIQGIIHICFECYTMINEDIQEFDVNMDIYPLLKSLLTELGHEIDS